jgi:hypothetical protein
MPLMLARQTEQQACQLARDVKTLVHWLAHVILALAGPGLVDRQGLFDFIVAELRHREHLDPPRIRPVRTALEKQRDDLLAFAGVLDHKLACIARDCDVPALERPPKKRLGGRDIPLWRGAGSRQFSHRCRPRDRGKLLMNAKTLAAIVLVLLSHEI